MNLKWLDDYLALIETGTFSAAAEKRHVSQPAFSRRIQLLEEWLSVKLVDREHKPVRFTPIATEYEAAFRSLGARIYEFRATLKSDSTQSPGLVIATLHSLATAHIPAFLAQMRELDSDQRFRIRSENHEEGVALLVSGRADILITYEDPQTSNGLPPQLASSCPLGDDALVLVASSKLCASEDFLNPDKPLPLLCFPPDSFFGKSVRSYALPELMRDRLVSVQYVSEFSLGLREMALIDQGAAWLPRALIAQDLKQGALCELPSVGRSVPLRIVAYFANNGGKSLQDLMARLVLAQDTACANPAVTP